MLDDPWKLTCITGTHKHPLQLIQVECFTVSVVAFVVTVDLIALQGKMTDVARRE